MSAGFAEAFSRLRKEKGISQRQAAADFGISQALLSHYENGIREPKLDFIVKACEYYGVSADYMLGRTGIKANPLCEFTRDEADVTRLMDCVASILNDAEDGDAAVKYFESAVYKLAGCLDAGDRALCGSYMALQEAKLTGGKLPESGELSELEEDMRRRLMDYKR